jgi:hypothetical protein
VYIAGGTSSVDATFPGVIGGAQPSAGGGIADGFISRFSMSLQKLKQSTFAGDDRYNIITGIAFHPLANEIVVTGQSALNPVLLTGHPLAKTMNNNYDSFVARYSYDLRNDAVPQPLVFAPKTGVQPGSRQVSNAAVVTGGGGLTPIAITGGSHAQYCISSATGCGCDVAPFSADASAVQNGQYVCVRQQAPLAIPAANVATLDVGGRAATFVVSTGALGGGNCNLDVDGNGVTDALTDGILMLRAMFGLTGSSVTANAIGGGATRTTWTQIQSHLNTNCGGQF